MTIGRVVGNVWATRKHSALDKFKLLLVQPVETASGRAIGEPALAVDNKFGAGPGDTVLLLDEGGGARQILKNPKSPVRLVVCGIVDIYTVQGKDYKFH